MDNIKKIEEQYDKIYRYCYYRLQHRETAEDITQETFLRVFQKEQYRLSENPLRIMYTIARNLCIDENRRRKNYSAREIGETGKMDGLCDKGIEDNIVINTALKEAMGKLDEIGREIIFLRIVNEEPLAVIGNLLHVSRYAVYRKYRHALQQLREELEGKK